MAVFLHWNFATYGQGQDTVSVCLCTFYALFQLCFQILWSWRHNPVNKYIIPVFWLFRDISSLRLWCIIDCCIAKYQVWQIRCMIIPLFLWAVYCYSIILGFLSISRAYYSCKKWLYNSLSMREQYSKSPQTCLWFFYIPTVISW